MLYTHTVHIKSVSISDADVLPYAVATMACMLYDYEFDVIKGKVSKFANFPYVDPPTIPLSLTGSCCAGAPR